MMICDDIKAYNNSKITDVNHLKYSLIELKCKEKCGIDQKGINELRILEK